MSKHIPGMVLCIAMYTIHAPAQTSPPQAQAVQPEQSGDVRTIQNPNGPLVSDTISNESVYYDFITLTGEEDKRIMKMQAAGQDTSKTRWNYAVMTRMSDDEAAQMLRLTLEGYQSLKAKEQEQQEAIRSWKQAYNSEQRHQMGTPQNLVLLEQERWGVVSQTMGILKNALGDESYAKLNKFTFDTWGPQKPVKGAKKSPPPGFIDPATLLPGPNATKVPQ